MASEDETTGVGEGAAPRPGADEASRPPLDRVLDGLRETSTIQRMVAGGAAWAITVTPGAFARGASGWTQTSAALALCAGLAGPALLPLGKRLSRHVGITAFLVLAVVAWATSGAVLSPARLDAVRAGLGAVAWGLYALSWSDPWPVVAASTEPDAPKLAARATLPPFAVAIALLGVLTGFLCIALAWRVADPDRALLAHVVAIATAVALITASGTLATLRGKKRVPSRRLPSSALRPMIILGVVAAGGAVLLAIR